MDMRMMRNVILSSLVLGLFTYAPVCAADENVIAQGQILNQKEQQITSKLTEETNAGRVRQGMTKSGNASVGLEVFNLPKEGRSF